MNPQRLKKYGFQDIQKKKISTRREYNKRKRKLTDKNEKAKYE